MPKIFQCPTFSFRLDIWNHSVMTQNPLDYPEWYYWEKETKYDGDYKREKNPNR
jgi:hypothetical protein